MTHFVYKQLVASLLLAVALCMPSKASDCKFEDLPPEVATQVLHLAMGSLVDPVSPRNVALVCRKWSDIAHDPATKKLLQLFTFDLAQFPGDLISAEIDRLKLMANIRGLTINFYSGYISAEQSDHNKAALAVLENKPLLRVLHLNAFNTNNFFQTNAGDISGTPAAEFLQLPHMQCFENIQELIIGEVYGMDRQVPYFHLAFIGALTNLTKVSYKGSTFSGGGVEWSTQTRPTYLNKYADKISIEHIPFFVFIESCVSWKSLGYKLLILYNQSFKMVSMTQPSYLNFDHKVYHWKKDVDYRLNPQQYRVGKGEQGVLICEPYKSEIGQYWRFKTPDIANESSNKIYELFLNYLEVNEFVGADMARKYLQMGFTRARRYCNYKGGKKYDQEDYHLLEKGTGDPQKAISAAIFYEKWQLAEANLNYQQLKTDWKEKYG